MGEMEFQLLSECSPLFLAGLDLDKSLPQQNLPG